MRYQLPASSPITSAALLRGALCAARLLPDVGETLRTQLQERFTADRAVLCASGTAALQLALSSLRARLGADAAVALPAFSCFDVATAAVGAGVPIRFYDLDPATLNPDPDSLRAALRAGARGIVVAPLFGIPVDWDTLSDAARAFDAVLIEDAAQGHGAAWRGRPLGSLAPISVLSFGRGKGWTGGAGGALLLRSGWSSLAPQPSAAGSAQDTGVLGRALAQWTFARPSLYALPRALPGVGLGETHYRTPDAAVRGLSRTAAALLLATATQAEQEAASRRRNATRYLAAELWQHTGNVFCVPAAAQPGWLRFPLRISSGMSRERLLAHGRKLGVEGSYPRPLTELPAVQQLRLDPGEVYAGAWTLATELLTLPTHGRLSPSDVRAASELVTDAAAAD
ncbi:MAG: DegT/DnrJ/EryC1/StrS family aminotransferase [Longimicrobiales bacterium]